LRVPPMFKDKTAIEAKYWTFPELWEEYNKWNTFNLLQQT
jgi:hypothetical protein